MIELEQYSERAEAATSPKKEQNGQLVTTEASGERGFDVSLVTSDSKHYLKFVVC